MTQAASTVFKEVLAATWEIEDRSSRTDALQKMAAALAEGQLVFRAFEALGARDLAEFVRVLAEWAKGFEQIEPGLTLRVLREAIDVISWRSTHAILVATTEK